MKNQPGFQSVVINGFRAGSVIVDSSIIFSKPIEQSKMQAAIVSAAQTNTNLNIDAQKINVAEVVASTTTIPPTTTLPATITSTATSTTTATITSTATLTTTAIITSTATSTTTQLTSTTTTTAASITTTITNTTTNITSTPITSTSTTITNTTINTTTTPTTYLMSLKLTMNLTFTATLNDKASADYIQLKTKIETFV